MDYDTIDFYRMRLPHWEIKRGIYFVTMHVKGSIPRHALKELEQCASEPERLQGSAKREKYRYMFNAVEEALHADRKIDYLTRPLRFAHTAPSHSRFLVSLQSLASS